MPWVESYNSRSNAQFDAANGHATLTYIVTLTAPNQNPFAESGAPGWATAHPVYTGLKLNGFSQGKQIVSGVFEIQAMYGTDTFGVIPPKQRELAQDYKYYTGGARRKMVKAPMFQAVKVPSLDSNSNVIYLDKYEKHDLQIESFEADYEVRCAVPTLSASDIALVFSQYNKFHTINGKICKFVNFRFSNNDPKKYDLVYTWTYDNGNQGLGNGTNQSGRILPPPRAAWEEYMVNPPSTPIDASGGMNPPVIVTIQGYVSGDIGSTAGFPGNPLS